MEQELAYRDLLERYIARRAPHNPTEQPHTRSHFLLAPKITRPKHFAGPKFSQPKADALESPSRECDDRFWARVRHRLGPSGKGGVVIVMRELAIGGPRRAGAVTQPAGRPYAGSSPAGPRHHLGDRARR